MESITLRQKLHHLIDTTSEDKLKDIYDSFQKEEYSEDFKAMLDNEYNTYQEDGEGIMRHELESMIAHLFNKEK